MNSFTRELQDSEGTTSQCYCPVGNPEARPPTEEEFKEVYNKNIEFLRAEGNITSIVAVE